MAKILIKSVKLIGGNWLSGWIKTNIELNKSNLEAVRKSVLSSYPGAKQCLFIYEEKG